MSTSESDLTTAEQLFWDGKAKEGLALLSNGGEPTDRALKGRYYLWLANCQIALNNLTEATWSVRMARGFMPNDPDVSIAEQVLKLKRSDSAVEKTTGFDLAKVAEELTRERPLVKPSPGTDTSNSVDLTAGTESDSMDERLVSDTLAGILLTQGKLVEAKKVYIQLARKDPRQFDLYNKKIEAIDNLLNG